MTMRHSDAFNIRKKDIGKTVFARSYKDIKEWWIYRKKESRFVDAVGKNLRTDEEYLYCIIACEGDNYGKKLENEEYIAVEGVRFTGEDLHEYLSKIGRTDGLLKGKEAKEDDNPTTIREI